MGDVVSFDAKRLQPAVHGNRHTAVYADVAHITFEYITPTTTGLTAWVEVRWKPDPATNRLLCFGTFNLMGARTVTTLANLAGDREPRMPWTEILTDAIHNIVRIHLDGEEPEQLAARTRPDGARWLLRPLILTSGATILVAQADSMKSMLALAAGAAVASGDTHWLGWKPTLTGPVLYLDWEASADDHTERLHALADRRPLPDQLWYRKERMPLHRSTDVLARECDELGVVLVVVDSVMLARSGEAEGSDSTIRFYAALREIGRPALLIDHKSREAIRKKRRGTYGSVVSENSARLVWEITDVIPTADGGRYLRLEQGKSNNVGRLKPIAFQVRVETGGDDGDRLEAVRIRQTDPQRAATLAAGVEDDSLAGRIYRFLVMEDTPRSVREIADGVETSESSVRNQLSRWRDRFQRVDAGSKTLWQVPGRGPSQEELPDPW